MNHGSLHFCSYRSVGSLLPPGHGRETCWLQTESSASASCVNVCNKVIQVSGGGHHPTMPCTSVRENTRAGPCRTAPVNFHKPLWALSHFSWTNRRRWRGQRAPQDVLPLPMRNVSSSHGRGITNSPLSVSTRNGGCSKVTAPQVHRGLRTTRGQQRPDAAAIYLIHGLETFWLEHLIFQCLSRGKQPVTPPRAVNTKG